MSYAKNNKSVSKLLKLHKTHFKTMVKHMKMTYPQYGYFHMFHGFYRILKNLQFLNWNITCKSIQAERQHKFSTIAFLIYFSLIAIPSVQFSRVRNENLQCPVVKPKSKSKSKLKVISQRFGLWKVFVTDQQTDSSSRPKFKAISFPIHSNTQNQNHFFR